MADALVDASYLVALGYHNDKNYSKAVAFAENTEHHLLIPAVVLPEVFHILRRVGGTRAILQLGDDLIAEEAIFVALTSFDFHRSMTIMRQYRDAELDFVDSCLVALAERLNITHICTFDRRDFSIIRPQHTPYFTLLP